MTLREVGDLLVARWRAAWEATPEAARAVETAASVAAYVAAEHVLSLDDADLEALRVELGAPPLWDAARAVAALTSLAFGAGFLGWARSRSADDEAHAELLAGMFSAAEMRRLVHLHLPELAPRLPGPPVSPAALAAAVAALVPRGRADWWRRIAAEREHRVDEVAAVARRFGVELTRS